MVRDYLNRRMAHNNYVLLFMELCFSASELKQIYKKFLYLRMCAKKNIKFDILETSRVLFNTYSWGKTSLRKIASELEISDGNLRYHFKTKERIVLELFYMMSNEMAALIVNRESLTRDNIDNLHLQFERIFKILYRYRFLIIEAYFIKRAYDSYLTLFNQLEKARKLLFIGEFNKLKEQGILSKDFSDRQYEMLFEQIFIISDSWIKYLESNDEPYVSEKIKHYANLCYGLLVPYMVGQN